MCEKYMILYKTVQLNVDLTMKVLKKLKQLKKLQRKKRLKQMEKTGIRQIIKTKRTVLNWEKLLFRD